MKEFGEALVLASKGVNAIALVISAKSRYTTNEKTTIDKLSQFQELGPFMFIIFAHANSLGTSEEEQRKKHIVYIFMCYIYVLCIYAPSALICSWLIVA